MSTLKLLKHATYDCHVRVENRLDLLSSHLSQERYIAILAAFYGFYAPLEAQWHQYIEQPMYGPLLEGRLKTPLLYNDLVALQLKTDTLVSLPLCAYTPQQETRMDVLGSITPAAAKPSTSCRSRVR